MGSDEESDAKASAASESGSIDSLLRDVARADAKTPTADLVGKTLAHFRVRSKLGQGGMGVVYLALDEKLRRDVALKVLPAGAETSAAQRQRFLREARAAAAITHACIAAVYEIGEAEGHAFIAMELVKGVTLRERMGAGLAISESVRIARDVARGLAKAHERGVVHRDLKPDNVMLTEEGDVKILDFGIAKMWEASGAGGAGDALADTATPETGGPVTAHGHVMGTPAYMSPEQARGEAADARSDVFSFGAMLYEMVCGARPFQGEISIAVLYAVIHTEPTAANVVNPAVPEALATLVMKCLAKSREHRVASGRELAVALDSQLQDLVSGESRSSESRNGQSRSAESGGGESRASGNLGMTPDIVVRPSGGAIVSGEGTELAATVTPESLAARVAPPAPSAQATRAEDERAADDANAEDGRSKIIAEDADSVAGARPARKLPSRTVVASLLVLGTIAIGIALSRRATERAFVDRGTSASASASVSVSAAPSAPLRLRVISASRGPGENPWDVSPSGAEIAYSTDESEIWVGPSDGSARRLSLPQRLDPEAIDDVAFLDERTLRVTTSSPASRGVPVKREAWAIGLDGAGRPLGTIDEPEALRAPGGRRALFIDDSGAWVGNVDGTNRQAVAGVRFSGCFAFSPDGESFAYVEQTTEAKRLMYRASAAGAARVLGTQRYLSHRLGAPCGLAFLDGSTLLAARYSGLNDEDAAIVRLDLRDSDPGTRARTLGVWHDVAFWSLKTRGNRVYGLQSLMTQAIVSVSLNSASTSSSGGLSIAVLDANENTLASVDGDGGLAFLSMGPEGRQLRLGVPGGESHRAFRDDRVDYNGRIASDGALLAIRGAFVDAGSPQCSLVRMAGNGEDDSRELYHSTGSLMGIGVSECGWLACAARANVCVLVGEGELGTVVTRFDPKTGARDPRQVFGALGRSFALSPDGRKLASVDEIKPGMGQQFAVLDLESGARSVVHLTVALDQLQSVAFTPDGKSYLLSGITDSNTGAPLYLVVVADLAGNARIVYSDKAAWLYGPGASPDGQRVYFTRRTYSSNLVVLEP